MIGDIDPRRVASGEWRVASGECLGTLGSQLLSIEANRASANWQSVVVQTTTSTSRRGVDIDLHRVPRNALPSEDRA